MVSHNRLAPINELHVVLRLIPCNLYIMVSYIYIYIYCKERGHANAATFEPRSRPRIRNLLGLAHD